MTFMFLRYVTVDLKLIFEDHLNYILSEINKKKGFLC